MLKVIKKRYQIAFKQSMPAKALENTKFQLEECFARERLLIEYLPDGTLAYFASYSIKYMGEFLEAFFHVGHCYCVPDKIIRRKFFKAIQNAAIELQSFHDIKRIAIEISFEDKISQKYYAKKGFLTYIELVGHTENSLKKLADIDLKKTKFKISLLQKKDIPKLIELDLQSHISDKSSRMREIFMRPDARESMKMFYNGLLNHGTCFVAKSGKKIAGDVGLFNDPVNNYGLIAAIFVADDFKNQGLSKLLYKRVLLKFKKKKCVHYLGATTTTGVLKMARKMERFENKYSYILKI